MLFVPTLYLLTILFAVVVVVVDSICWTIAHQTCLACSACLASWRSTHFRVRVCGSTFGGISPGRHTDMSKIVVPSAGLPPKPLQQDGPKDAEPSTYDHQYRSTSQTEDEIRVVYGGNVNRFRIMRGQIPEDLKKELARDFKQSELDAIYARVYKTLAPAAAQPAALFVLGPSAVGKSVMTSAQATALFGNDCNAVILDGATFRHVHAGFQAVAVHGMESRALHADAWEIFKSVQSADGGGGISTKLKQRIFEETIRDRQNIVVPDCVNAPNKLNRMIDKVCGGSGRSGMARARARVL